MEHFDIKNPAEWEPILAGETVEFVCSGKTRSVDLTVNTTGPVNIYYADNSDMTGRVLIGRVEGMARLQFTTKGHGYVQCESPEGTVVYMKGNSRSHLIAKTSDEVFTNIEPRGPRNHEFDAMMRYVKMNEARREAQMAAELKLMREEMAKRPDAAPAPAPAPTTETKEEVIEDDASASDAATADT